MNELNSTSTADRRFHPRVPCEIRDSNGQTIRNISLGGASIMSHFNYSQDQDIHLEFPLPYGGEPLKLRGRVVRKETTEGMKRTAYGVVFSQIGPPDLQRLGQFLLREPAKSKSTLQVVDIAKEGERYRPNRLGPEFLNGLYAECFLTLGKQREQVNLKNVSQYGACVTSSHALKIDAGGIIKELLIVLEGREIFRGPVQLRQYYKGDESYEYGFQLCEKPIDLGLIFAVKELSRIKGSVAGLKEKVEKTLGIRTDFKVAISELRFVLDNLKSRMEDEQKTLDGLLSNSLQGKMFEDECLELVDTQFRRKVHDLMSVMEEIFRNLPQEEHSLYMEYCRDTLIAYFHDSPFVKRGYQKPLGYPGDFEMMRMMYDGKYSGETLWQKVVNNFFWTLATPQAVRNRSYYIRDKVKEAVALNPREPKHIMSLACGPCEELRLLFSDSTDPLGVGKEPTFHLVDYDHHALDFVHDALRRFNLKRRKEVVLATYRINVRDFMKDPDVRKQFPPQDLIYTAGLFDYLSDELAELLVGILYFMLKPGGRIVVGNFSPFNSFRLAQEFALDWFLTYRDERALKNLVPKELKCSRVFVEEEPSHINLFLNVIRAKDEGKE